MNRALEIYYLSGIPVTMCFVAASVMVQRSKVRWLAASLLSMGCWVGAMFWLQSRAEKIRDSNISRTEQAVRELGSPDLVIEFAEGDSLWMYAVRVWPWNEALGLNLYHGQVLSGQRWREAEFFFEPIAQRTAEESAHAKAFLARLEPTQADSINAPKK